MKKKFINFLIGLIVTVFVTIPVIILSDIDRVCRYKNASCVRDIILFERFWIYFGVVAVVVFFIHIFRIMLRPFFRKINFSEEKFIYVVVVVCGFGLGLFVVLKSF